MMNPSVSTIYEQTRSLIQGDTPNETEQLLALYRQYLTDKYEDLIRDLAETESAEMLDGIMASFVEDEIGIWSGLSTAEIRSLLLPDPAYEHLSFLSEVAFAQARDCLANRKYYDNDEEYALRLEEIAACLDAILPEHLDAAKELLSETILDIDYIFGKSENTSFRLSHMEDAP